MEQYFCMSMDYEMILKNGFAWRKDSKVLQYLVLLIAIGLAFLIGVAFLIESATGEFLSAYLRSANVIASLMPLIGLFIGLILVSIVIGLIQGFIYTLIVLRGMNYYKIKTSNFGIVKFIKLLILYFFSFIFAFISYYNKKFLLFFIGLIALFIFGFASMFVSPQIGFVLIVLAFIASIFYIGIIIYNSFRLSMAPFVFLEKEDVFGSLREGYEITRGRVVDIFVALLIVTIIIMIVSFFADQIGQLLLFGFYPELIGLQQGTIEPIQLLAIGSSLIKNMAGMIILSGVVSTIVSGIMSAFTAFAYAGIYFEVRPKKASKQKKI